MIPAARPSWRLLAAIVQIAAFFALAMPGLSHAHGGGHRVGATHDVHADAAPHAHHGAVADRQRPLQAVAAAFVSDDAAGGAVQGSCCVGCCCHAFLAGPDLVAPAPHAAGRAPAPPGEVAYADLTPETLPEPPRLFA